MSIFLSGIIIPQQTYANHDTLQVRSFFQLNSIADCERYIRSELELMRRMGETAPKLSLEVINTTVTRIVGDTEFEFDMNTKKIGTPGDKLIIQCKVSGRFNASYEAIVSRSQDLPVYLRVPAEVSNAWKAYEQIKGMMKAFGLRVMRIIGLGKRSAAIEIRTSEQLGDMKIMKALIDTLCLKRILLPNDSCQTPDGIYKMPFKDIRGAMVFALGELADVWRTRGANVSNRDPIRIKVRSSDGVVRLTVSGPAIKGFNYLHESQFSSSSKEYEGKPQYVSGLYIIRYLFEFLGMGILRVENPDSRWITEKDMSHSFDNTNESNTQGLTFELIVRTDKVKLTGELQEMGDEALIFDNVLTDDEIAERLDFRHIKDTERLSMLINDLEEGKENLIRGDRSYERYEEIVLRPLYVLFFKRLQEEFSNAEGFINTSKAIISSEGYSGLRTRMNTKDRQLVNTFLDIRSTSSNRRMSIGFYGMLLCYLTGNADFYFRHLYEETMKSRSSYSFSLAKKGISYYARANSIVHFFNKTILFENPKNQLFRNSLGGAGKNIFHLARENDISGEAKVNKALELLTLRGVSKNSNAIRKRVENIIENTSIVILENKFSRKKKEEAKKEHRSITQYGYDLDTYLLFSDPDNFVARPMHISRSNNALFFSPKYIESLDINNPDHMNELALWLNYGQRVIDMQNDMLMRKKTYKQVQYARFEMDRDFFKTEDTGLVSSGKLRGRLAEFVKEDTIFEYGKILRDVIELERVADCEKNIAYLTRNGYAFGETWKMYGRVLYRFKAMGMHSRAKEVFDKMVEAAHMIQYYDWGKLPYDNQYKLVFIALRFGYWDDFLRELNMLLTGAGYKRMIRKSEISFIVNEVIVRDTKRSKNFVTDIERAFAERIESANPVERADVLKIIGKAREIIQRFCDDPEASLMSNGILDTEDMTGVPYVHREKTRFMDIRTPEVLVKNFFETSRNMMLDGQKVVLAFHDGIVGKLAGLDAEKLELCIRELARLKDSDDYRDLFANLIIVPKFTTGEDIKKALEENGVDSLDKDKNCVLTFSLTDNKEILKDMPPGVKPILIDDKEFVSSECYYPLLEVVLLSLVRTNFNLSMFRMYYQLRHSGVLDLSSLNISEIQDIEDKAVSYVLFTLVPKIKRIDVEKGTDRYALIYRAIRAAA